MLGGVRYLGPPPRYYQLEPEAGSIGAGALSRDTGSSYPPANQRRGQGCPEPVGVAVGRPLALVSERLVDSFVRGAKIVSAASLGAGSVVRSTPSEFCGELCVVGVAVVPGPGRGFVFGRCQLRGSVGWVRSRVSARLRCWAYSAGVQPQSWVRRR
jgi:hypothetical protein